MRYRVVTVKEVKPSIVIERYPLLNEYGFYDGVVSIKTPEELQQLVKDLKCPVILYGHSCYGPKDAGLLEIYDEYRE